MTAVALLKYNDALNTGLGGEAFVSASGQNLVITNNDDTNVASWRVSLLYAPPGSFRERKAFIDPITVVQSESASSVVSTSLINLEAIPGCYRIMLEVWDGPNYTGVRDVDIRCVATLTSLLSGILPPYQKDPDPLPLEGAGAKPDELNFPPTVGAGQTYGWCGDLDGSRRLVNAMLLEIDSSLSSMSGIDWQESVLSRTVTDPSTLTPSPGDRYIVAVGSVGVWSSKVNQIAEWNGSSWDYTFTDPGMATYVFDVKKHYVFNGTAWVLFGTGAGLIPPTTGEEQQVCYANGSLNQDYASGVKVIGAETGLQMTTLDLAAGVISGGVLQLPADGRIRSNDGFSDIDVIGVDATTTGNIIIGDFSTLGIIARYTGNPFMVEHSSLPGERLQVSPYEISFPDGVSGAQLIHTGPAGSELDGGPFSFVAQGAGSTATSKAGGYFWFGTGAASGSGRHGTFDIRIGSNLVANRVFMLGQSTLDSLTSPAPIADGDTLAYDSSSGEAIWVTAPWSNITTPDYAENGYGIAYVNAGKTDLDYAASVRINNSLNGPPESAIEFWRAHSGGVVATTGDIRAGSNFTVYTSNGINNARVFEAGFNVVNLGDGTYTDTANYYVKATTGAHLFYGGSTKWLALVEYSTIPTIEFAQDLGGAIVVAQRDPDVSTKKLVFRGQDADWTAGPGIVGGVVEFHSGIKAGPGVADGELQFYVGNTEIIALGDFSQLAMPATNLDVLTYDASSGQAYWAAAGAPTAHAPSHITGGGDIIPNVTNAATGLVPIASVSNGVLRENGAGAAGWALLVDANIAVGAAIAVTKLALGGANQVLAQIGGTNQWSAMTADLHGDQTDEDLHALVVAATSHGFMSSADKTKLDGLTAPTGGNNYQLAYANAGVLNFAGGINVLNPGVGEDGLSLSRIEASGTDLTLAAGTGATDAVILEANAVEVARFDDNGTSPRQLFGTGNATIETPGDLKLKADGGDLDVWFGAVHRAQVALAAGLGLRVYDPAGTSKYALIDQDRIKWETDNAIEIGHNSAHSSGAGQLLTLLGQDAFPTSGALGGGIRVDTGAGDSNSDGEFAVYPGGGSAAFAVGNDANGYFVRAGVGSIADDGLVRLPAAFSIKRYIAAGSQRVLDVDDSADEINIGWNQGGEPITGVRTWSSTGLYVHQNSATVYAYITPSSLILASDSPKSIQSSSHTTGAGATTTIKGQKGASGFGGGALNLYGGEEDTSGGDAPVNLYSGTTLAATFGSVTASDLATVSDNDLLVWDVSDAQARYKSLADIGGTSGTGTDHRIARWDVAAGALQDSLVEIDDSGNLIMAGSNELRWGTLHALHYNSVGTIFELGLAGASGVNMRIEGESIIQLVTGNPTPAVRATVGDTEFDLSVDLNMNNNDIIMGTGLVDGVDVSDHGARHITGGGDTIPNVTTTATGLVPAAIIDGGVLQRSGSSVSWATLVDANISASADIAVSKLADGAANEVLVTNATGSTVVWLAAGSNGEFLGFSGGALGWYTPAGGITTPGTTTLNAIPRWGDISGDSLLNSGITIDASDNMDMNGGYITDAAYFETNDAATPSTGAVRLGDGAAQGIWFNDGADRRAMYMGTTGDLVIGAYTGESGVLDDLELRVGDEVRFFVDSGTEEARVDNTGISIFNEDALRLYDGVDGSDYVAVKAVALTATWTLTLPPNDGTSGQVLRTNGSGVTSWVDQPTGGEGAGQLATVPAASCDLYTFQVLNGYTAGGVIIPAADTTVNYMQVLLTQAGDTGETVRGAIYLVSTEAKIEDTDSVATDAGNGFIEMTFDSAVSLTAGVAYYVAITVDGDTNPRFAGHTSAAFNVDPRFSFENQSGYCPDPLNPSGTTNGVPWISLY